MPLGNCKIKGCTNKTRCKDLCSYHYEKQRKEKAGKICKISSCNKIIFASGYCGKHYYNYRQTGNPLLCKQKKVKNKYFSRGDITYLEINTTKEGKKPIIILLDTEDFLKVSQYKNWTFYNYAQTKKEGKFVYLHHLIMNISPSHETQVDHINGIKWDNRKNNLQICTPSQNQLKAKPKGRTTPYPGVRRNKNKDKWTAAGIINGKNYFLGYFSTKEEAIQKRISFEKENFGRFLPEHHYKTERNMCCASSYHVSS